MITSNIAMMISYRAIQLMRVYYNRTIIRSRVKGWSSIHQFIIDRHIKRGWPYAPLLSYQGMQSPVLLTLSKSSIRHFIQHVMSCCQDRMLHLQIFWLARTLLLSSYFTTFLTHVRFHCRKSHADRSSGSRVCHVNEEANVGLRIYRDHLLSTAVPSA